MGTEVQRRPSGLVIGGLIGTVFGLVFVEVNSSGLSDGWMVAVRIAGGVIGAALLAALVRARRQGLGHDSGNAVRFGGRKYRIIVAAEVVALVGGLVVINAVLDRPEVAVAWVALVLGLHFYGFGASFGLKRFHVLATALTVLGLAGFVLYFAGASATTIAVVSGICSGLALYASVGGSLVQERA